MAVADGTASSWSKGLLPLKTVPEPNHIGVGVPMSTRADQSLGTGPGRGCWRRQWTGGVGAVVLAHSDEASTPLRRDEGLGIPA